MKNEILKGVKKDVKNIKIGEDANEKLVHYSAIVKMSKREFLDTLLIEISPYELQNIFSRVLLRFRNIDEDENFCRIETDVSEDDVYDDDEDDEQIEFEEEYEEIKGEIKGL